LTVADNGVGIPDAIDLRTTESLGLSLVTLLAEEQLNGTIDLDRDKGTVFCITFEK
jgi:two-component sensor histidine kinase